MFYPTVGYSSTIRRYCGSFITHLETIALQILATEQ